MAVSTSNRFGSGAAIGVPQVAGNFNKFDMHKNAEFVLGYKVEDVDGAVYRYSHFGADTNRGVLVSQDVSESSWTESDNLIVASASCTDTTDGTIGSRFVVITAGQTASPITVNQFMGGKFITTDDTGEGYTYNIIGNTANATIGSTVRFELREKLQVAVTTDTDFIVMGNKYANLEIATAATDNIIAGVTCSTMDVSEQPYGWVQTKGMVGILQTGTAVLNERIVLSTGTSGAVTCASNLAESAQSLDQILGSCAIIGGTTGAGAFYINVD
jgi:hypothetical protein